ncbi:MAG: SDR family oxidoreductase [Planctomycetes bacterium]|nr:SDR family oxidoreductase [Planctomycetota bacterium]
MVRYLITGGAGFIGSHIATALVQRGDQVRILDDLSTGSTKNLEHLQVCGIDRGKPVEFLRGDVTDSGVLRRACDGVRGIFHEAAQVSVPKSIEDPERSYEVNVMGTLRLLQAAATAGVDRLVFAASSAAYGNTEDLPKVETMAPSPLSPYASGKLAAEQLLAVWGRTHGLHTVCLRYFNVFGPRQADDSPYTGVIAIFARALLEGRRVTIYGDGGQTRDFSYVDNVVNANLAAMDARDTSSFAPGEVINIGNGERISLLELYREIARLLGSTLEPQFAPDRPGDVRHSLASIAKARRLLGYEPAVGWREGLARTVEWYRERHSRARAAVG